jgi:hypothetical protein
MVWLDTNDRAKVAERVRKALAKNKPIAWGNRRKKSIPIFPDRAMKALSEEQLERFKTTLTNRAEAMAGQSPRALRAIPLTRERPCRRDDQ